MSRAGRGGRESRTRSPRRGLEDDPAQPRALSGWRQKNSRCSTCRGDPPLNRGRRSKTLAPRDAQPERCSDMEAFASNKYPRAVALHDTVGTSDTWAEFCELK